jgi:hypothetical protein
MRTVWFDIKNTALYHEYIYGFLMTLETNSENFPKLHSPIKLYNGVEAYLL